MKRPPLQSRSQRPASVKQTPGAFGPQWLATQLVTLVPGFPNVSLCVALSGGVDSTALLAALAAAHATAAANRPRSFQLRAIHVDHGLRPASKQWAAHCRTLARKLHVPLKVLTTKVERSRGTSLEAAARDARYGLLAAALHPGEILLTAHHSDDQLETVLLQLLRGSGLPGISAMPAVAPFADGFLARPLLSRSRAELETWAQEQGLTWVEDDSNADESLDRNYLRLRILPLIRNRWSGAATAVARSARHAAEAQSLLDALALADVNRSRYGESLSAKSLRALSPDRRRNALRFWITRAGFLAPDTRRLEEIAGPLLDARPDANPFVTWGEGEGSVCAQRHGDLLSLRANSPRGVSPRSSPTSRRSSSRAEPTTLTAPLATSAPLSARTTPRPAPTAPFPPRTTPPTTASAPAHATPPGDLVWSWQDSLTYDLPGDLGTLELKPDPRGPLDLDSLPPTLTIRWRVGGERLSPRRGGPRRALKNLLQESHVPVPERADLPLLFSTISADATSAAAMFSEQRLLAVADLLLDETVQATPTTRRRARLHWKKSSH